MRPEHALDQLVRTVWPQLAEVLGQALAEQEPALHARLKAAIAEHGIEYTPMAEGRILFTILGEPFCALNLDVFSVPDDATRH